LKAGRRSEDTLTSYLMHFKGRLLASGIFWDFWSGYQMANSRYQTVRRGERGLSAVLYRSEFVVGGFVDLHRFTEVVKTQVSISDLLIAVHYCALTDSRLLEARVDALRDYQAESESSFGGGVLRKFILSVVEKRPFVASFPYLAHVILGLPIQKWGSTMLQKLALCRTVDAGGDGVMKIHDSCAFREMRDLRDKYLREKAVTSIYRALLEPLQK